MTIGYVVDDAMFRPDLRWHQGESPFMRRDDARQRVHGRISRNAKPRLDGLEDRLLLYATTGGAWSQPARVTFSFVPDGTSIGGPTSALYSSLNAQHPGWQTVFQQAAAVWEAVANVNLVLVGDNGVATGVGSYVQGDPNNGDIRISATPQGTGALAFTFLPPPLNGYPEAGDIVFNSSQNWTTTTGYDLLTVAIHEFGHALGLGHSEITTADMYAYYNGFKTYLTADDVAGAQAIYGPRQMTPISTATVTNATNYTSKATALDITSLLNPTTGQVTLNNLDITSAYSGNWFQVTAPASTTGSMNVVMQSIGLSELSPRVQIIDGSTGLNLGYNYQTNVYGGIANLTINVTAGHSYYIKTVPASAGGFGAGNYALQVNFGSSPLPPISIPNTTVPDIVNNLGGGSSSDVVGPSSFGRHRHYPPGRGPGAGPNQDPSQTFGFATDYGNGLISIGSILGWGDAMTVKPQHAHASRHPSGPRLPTAHHVRHA
jgi:hypothetical protein